MTVLMIVWIDMMTTVLLIDCVVKKSGFNF
jgi:hypothetical protein